VLAYKAQLAIRQGDAKGGVKSLRDCLQKIRTARHGLILTEFNISLVQGLAAGGQFVEAMSLIDETIQLVETKGDTVHMPELLRFKGGLFLARPQPCVADAELFFERSLKLSRHQGARAWELRTAIDLAALFASQGKPKRGWALLQPVFNQFVEGADTADFKSARDLLSALDRT